MAAEALRAPVVTYTQQVGGCGRPLGSGELPAPVPALLSVLGILQSAVWQEHWHQRRLQIIQAVPRLAGLLTLDAHLRGTVRTMMKPLGCLALVQRHGEGQ